MSDSGLLHTVLASPKNSGQQQVTAPKLQFLAKEKPTAISNEEDSMKSSPTDIGPAKQDIPSLNESPISDEQNSGSKDLLMSPDLAKAFENVEQLPGSSFLNEALPESNYTCIFVLHH